jgi:tetratricopeptide (TPR) repeat protein
MAAAWRTHPAEYLLAYRIALLLWGKGDDRLPEMLAWARVAVALRPDSPFAHNLLGIAWRGMRNWGEAEASARRAVELSRGHPKYAGAHTALGNVLLQKGDLDGAAVSYRAALAIDPDSAGICYNLGLVSRKRGELAEAEQWYRKAVARAPANGYYREVLGVVARKRSMLLRLDEIAAGRARLATAAEGIEFAEVVSQSPRRRYVLAVRFYSQAFAADPGLADDLATELRHSAACVAARAAAGQDEEGAALGVKEWGHLANLALKWLRADLAGRASQAKDPRLWWVVREKLTSWKTDPALASVRDPASLAAMPPADRNAWEALWRDVDAVLASVAQRAVPRPAKP